MKQFRYIIRSYNAFQGQTNLADTRASHNGLPPLEDFSNLGDDGWELVSMVYLSGPGSYQCVFKKEIGHL